MRRAILVVAVSITVIGGICASPAGATAPGKNGDIVFRRFVADVGTLFTIKPDGTGEWQVLTPPEGSTDDFPDFASDRSLIAFERCADLCHAMVVRPDGSGLRQVGTDGGNANAALSPNVRRVSPSPATPGRSATTGSPTPTSTPRGFRAAACGG